MHQTNERIRLRKLIIELLKSEAIKLIERTQSQIQNENNTEKRSNGVKGRLHRRSNRNTSARDMYSSVIETSTNHFHVLAKSEGTNESEVSVGDMKVDQQEVENVIIDKGANAWEGRISEATIFNTRGE